MAPFALAAPLVQRGWSLWAVAAGFAAIGFLVVIYNITQVSFRQGLCPERLLGRMNATIRFLVWGTMPLGGLIAGVLGSTIGVRPTMWGGAIGVSLGLLPIFLSPLRTMRELPTTYDPEAEVTPGAGAGVAGPARN